MLSSESSVAESAAVMPLKELRKVMIIHRLKRVLVTLVVVVLATLSGWLASLVHIPLAWLLGALFASTVLALNGVAVNLDKARPYVLIFLGLGLGQSFNADVLNMLVTSLPAITLCALFTVFVGIVGAKIFVHFARLDPKTAFFCGVPGGVVLMAIHAREAGLSEQHVVFAQSVRLILVVLVYPLFVAALPSHTQQVGDISHVEWVPSLNTYSHLLLWWFAGLGAAIIGKKVGIPNPWMLAPCILAAGFAAANLSHASVPSSLIIVAQIALGITLGSNMTPDFIKGARKLVFASLLSSAILSALLIAFAALAVWTFDLPLNATLLGMAPGGMPEMAVTAHALGTSVPLVLGFHFIRVVFCNVLLETFWRCIRALRLI